MEYQHWILPGVNITISQTLLQRSMAWSIKQTRDNITDVEDSVYPSCSQFSYISLKYKPFIWKTCISTFGKIIQDHWVNWGPFGEFINTCSEWNITICDLHNVTRINGEKSEQVNGN